MSDADCTPGREPRSVAARLRFLLLLLFTFLTFLLLGYLRFKHFYYYLNVFHIYVLECVEIMCHERDLFQLAIEFGKLCVVERKLTDHSVL